MSLKRIVSKWIKGWQTSKSFPNWGTKSQHLFQQLKGGLLLNCHTTSPTGRQWRHFKGITFRRKIWLAFSFVRPVHYKRSKPAEAGSDLIYKTKKELQQKRKSYCSQNNTKYILLLKKKRKRLEGYFLSVSTDVKFTKWNTIAFVYIWLLTFNHAKYISKPKFISFSNQLTWLMLVKVDCYLK